jgi:hypothetical protein
MKDRSFTNKSSDSRGVLSEATTVTSPDDLPSKGSEYSSMRDPSDAATQRSKAFNSFYGLFFASGGLYLGYAAGILSPLGQKWLRFNFGIEDDAAFFFGIANLA